MKFRNHISIILPILVSCLFSCQVLAQENKAVSKKLLEQANAIILETQKKFAPDHRTAIFEVEARADKGGQINLSGKTNITSARDFLLQKLLEMKVKVKDRLKMLPDKGLSDEIYGVINLSVANIRSKPAHSAELATQGLLGMPVNILDYQGGWYLIQTPDDYISWVDEWGVTRMNKDKLNDWLSAKKIIFMKPVGFSYLLADIKAQTVSDLVAGNILRTEGEDGNFYKVLYPDGRIAFILKDDAKDYNEWLSEANPSVGNLIATGKSMTGIPYLWGGTSFKGVDCSGFTKTVFFLNGVIIQRDASQQVNSGELINTDNTYESLQAGDLLFFGKRGNENTTEKVSHVAIYLGNLQYINSSGMVRAGSFRSSLPDTSQYRNFSLIRGRRYLGHIGDKGISWIKDSPYYKIH